MSSGNGSALLDLNTARAALQAARGKQKLDLLFSAPDPLALVQSIPSDELYLAILDIGVDDSQELIALASPEQFVHFVDMACWPSKATDGPDPERVLRWLMLARETALSSDAALERYRTKLAGLDPELLSLTLRRELRLHDLQEEESPVLEHPGATYRTPEGRYLVEFISGDKHYAPLKALLDDLFAVDVFITTRMLESLRWEVPTELEETERRWRSARLRDLGVPELDEALSFFARPAKKQQAAAALAPHTQALTAPDTRPPLLQRALALLDGDDLARAEEGVLYTANAVVVANGAELDDAIALRSAVEEARAGLSLGLELLSDGDDERAADVLASTPMRQVFQAAMGESYRLQSRARKLQKLARLPQAQSVTLLDPPLADLVDSLGGTRPRLPDEMRRDEMRRGLSRSPSSRRDLAVAEALLDEAEATVQLLDALGIGPATLGPKAEEAGVAASALRASDALRQLVETQLRGAPFDLRALPDPLSPKAEGFAQKLDTLLQNGARLVHSEAGARAAARLKAHLLRTK